jgi:hypothetical protein
MGVVFRFDFNNFVRMCMPAAEICRLPWIIKASLWQVAEAPARLESTVLSILDFLLTGHLAVCSQAFTMNLQWNAENRVPMALCLYRLEPENMSHQNVVKAVYKAM